MKREANESDVVTDKPEAGLVERLRALREKATPGEWVLEHEDTAIAGPTINSDWAWVVWPNDEQDNEEQAVAQHNNRYLLALHNALPVLLAAQEKAERLEKALRRIERWSGEFPPTGLYWDENEGTKSQPMSYSAAFGSNGERDFMRGVAKAALSAPTEGESNG